MDRSTNFGQQQFQICMVWLGCTLLQNQYINASLALNEVKHERAELVTTDGWLRLYTFLPDDVSAI